MKKAAVICLETNVIRDDETIRRTGFLQIIGRCELNEDADSRRIFIWYEHCIKLLRIRIQRKKMKGLVKMENNQGLKRTLGLTSSIAMLTGCVVGASVFIVPGQLASSIGPAVWLSYLIGAVLILFGCFTFAQVGSVLPVPGASFMLCSRTVSGFWGFLYVWVYMISSVVLFPIMAYTMVRYAGYYIPGINNVWGAMVVLLLTGALNLRGFSLSAKIQNTLVILFITVIVIFCFGGFANFNSANFQPMFPQGLMPVVVGAISTYYAFAGFNGIIELSGEIKNPGRNIPRTIFTSLLIIIVIYLGMAIALVGLMPPSELGVDAPALTAADLIFPNWFGVLISLAAIAAAWTTLNAVIAAMSRDLYAMSKNLIFPAFFAKLNSSKTPYVAVITITLLGVISILAQAGIMKYVTVCGVYLMMTAIVISVAALRIKSQMPQEYEGASYKLKGFAYYFWPIGSIVSCLYFIGLSFKDDPMISILALALIPVGLLFYYIRKSILTKRNLNLDEVIKDSIAEEMKMLGESI